MATTSYASADNQTAKRWGNDLYAEALRQSVIGLLAGKGEDAFFQIRDDFKEGQKGDLVRVQLDTQLSGDGRQGSEPLEGFEEAHVSYTQDLTINEIRHATSEEGGISYQRQAADYSIRERAKNKLADWWEQKFDTSFLNQACSNTVADDTNTKNTGNNAVTAFSTDQRYLTGAANVQSLAAGDEFTLDHIVAAIAKGKTFNRADGTGDPLRPGKIFGKRCYVCIIHPLQARDLKTSTSTNGMAELAKAFFQGMGDNNPIAKGYFMGGTEVVGYWHNTLILENARIPYGIDESDGTYETDTRSAVLLGAQAVVGAFAKGNDLERMKWVEKTFDFDQYTAVAAMCIYGMVKARWNSVDHGVIQIPTYAV